MRKLFLTVSTIVVLCLLIALVACGNVKNDVSCAHELIEEPSVAPTCTENGFSSWKYCAKCGAIVEAKKTIPALGHDLEHHKAKTATCADSGWNAYDTCNRTGCNYSTFIKIPAKHDVLGDKECTVCGYFKNELKYSLNSDGESYTVVWSGNYSNYKGLDLKIPRSNYDGKPITIIGKGAFRNNLSFISVTIPESIVEIKEYAFTSCDRLVEIFNKSSLRFVKGSTYYGGIAENVKNVYSEKGGSILSTDSQGFVSYKADNETYLVAYNGVKSNITIPSYITMIAPYAFRNCNCLRSVEINDNVKEVGFGAFSVCPGIEKFILASIKTKDVFGEMFGNSDYEGGISINQYVCNDDRVSMFSFPSTLKSVTVRSGIIPSGYFWGCSNLTEVVLEEGVTEISYRSFMHCNGLTDMKIPNSVSFLGTGVFLHCTSLENVIIGTGVNCLSEWLFMGCTGLANLTIGKNVKSIADAFLYCSRLSNITYLGSVDEWNDIEKTDGWDNSLKSYTIHCSDGTLTK